MEMLTLNRPDALTKELAVGKTIENGRRVVISSNFLDMFGFAPTRRYERSLLPGGGFALSLNPAGIQRVYHRGYSRRRSNPCETLIDVRAQGFLDASIPKWAERVHVTMMPGKIAVRPVPNHSFHIRKAFRTQRDLSAFMALSSGVDAHCLQALGFRIAGLIEWRPPEKRDGAQNFTESGALTALANVSPGVLFNEDITRIDVRRVADLVDASRPVSILHICVQCDDHSSLKSAADKRRSIEDGTSTRDMVYDALRLAEALKPATVLVECVAPFASSSECDMMRVRLARWGYSVQVEVLDARDHGGYTSRRRAYLVASLFPGFSFPAPLPRRTTPIWPDFADEIALCRDVSDSISVQKGVTVGSGRTLTRHLAPEATSAPCLVKSQSHMPKDGLYLRTADGRVLFPTERLFARLNEIPSDFTFEATSQSLALEQIGQSISYRMHHRLIASIKDHLLLQRGPGAGAIVTNAVCRAEMVTRESTTADARQGQTAFAF